LRRVIDVKYYSVVFMMHFAPFPVSSENYERSKTVTVEEE
jgi:hypothetical protein